MESMVTNLGLRVGGGCGGVGWGGGGDGSPKEQNLRASYKEMLTVPLLLVVPLLAKRET